MTDTINKFDPDFASPSDFAAFYRALGIQVVPAMPPEVGKAWKRPAVPWRALENALIPDDAFQQWYGATGQFSRRQNLGIITGRASRNIFVIDLDLQKQAGAAFWWENILDVAPNLSELETATQTTGGGGKQMLFAAPNGWTPPTCKTPIGVDIRGQGGFAVLPPSLHESGKEYSWDNGLEPWAVGIADAPEWLCIQIDKLASAYGTTTNGFDVNQDSFLPVTGIQTPTPAQQFSPTGLLIDGREDYMTKIIWARMVDLKRDAPMISKAEMDENRDDVYQMYLSNVKTRLTGVSNEDGLEREGRGRSLFLQKWANAAKQWDNKVAEHANAPKAERPQPARPSEPAFVNYRIDTETGEVLVDPPPTDIFEFLDVKQIKSMKDAEYVVDKIMPENSFGIVVGAPGCGKSFLELGKALAISSGQAQWFGHAIKKHGATIYITSEGLSDMKFRIMAWEQHYGVSADEVPFFLIHNTINFMSNDDTLRLLKTVAYIAKLHGAPTAVFVDTISRVLPGADENLQKDMTIFIAACDAVRQAFKCSVTGVHHTSRNGNLRGSTVFEGAADYILMIERESGDSFGTIFAKKIKTAQDGWEKAFELRSVDVGMFGSNTSLVAIETTTEEKVKPKWPDKSVLESVLRAMQRDFDDRKAWAMSKNARYQAVRNFCKLTGATVEMAQQILSQWQDNGVIEIDCCDKKEKRFGFRVVGSISGEV